MRFRTSRETETAGSASLRGQAMGENTALLAPPEPLIEADEPEPDPQEAVEEETAPAGRPPVPVHSFEAFFESQHTTLLRAMYLICGNRHEAEELAQDAFVRAYERWHLVSRADNPAGYLYRIGLNLYRSKLRRAARAARKVVKPPAEADPFGAADDRDAIGRALATLPKGQRKAVVMVEWLGNDRSGGGRRARHLADHGSGADPPGPRDAPSDVEG